MQSQDTPGKIPKAAFALTRRDTPHPSGAKNKKTGGGERAGSPDLGARSKHPQARGMAVSPTLGKGQRTRTKPKLIKTSMDGGARWSAEASAEKAPVVKRNTQISFARTATNVQMVHARKAARQKLAEARKTKAAKAKKRNGVLVLTEDNAAAADEQDTRLQLEKAKADALAEKQAAKKAKETDKAEKNRQAVEAKAAEM